MKCSVEPRIYFLMSFVSIFPVEKDFLAHKFKVVFFLLLTTVFEVFCSEKLFEDKFKGLGSKLKKVRPNRLIPNNFPSLRFIDILGILEATGSRLNVYIYMWFVLVSDFTFSLLGFLLVRIYINVY